MNTRFERLDNGRVHWFDLDLPDVIDLRRRFFSDTDRRKMIATSIMDTDWMDEVSRSPSPYCFVSEAVIIYLEAEQVRSTIERIVSAFPGSWILTDTTASRMVRKQNKHDAMKYMSKESWFRWECDDPEDMENFAPGIRLIRSRSFAEADPNQITKLPWFPYRFFFRYMPWLIRNKINDYRMNVLVHQPDAK